MASDLIGVLVAGAVALSVPGGAPIGEPGVRRIPARIAAQRLLVVPVRVNGTGPYPFLLDTGATSSMLDEELARDLHLRPAGVGLQQTSTGAGRVRLLRATLALGTVEREGEVIGASLAPVRGVDPALRGIVGQDLLRLGNWWLDYRGASVLQDTGGVLGVAQLGERLSLHWLGERPAIDTLLPDRRSLLLVLDSAAASAVMFGGDHAQGESDGRAEMTTLDDRITVRVGSVGPLRAGRVAVPRFAAALLAGGEGRPEDGLLPTALFEGVYFDNRAGTVVLNPRRQALSGIP
jgi:hypothetical protein